MGRENTTDYTFGRKYTGHPFCKTCGVQAHQNAHGPPQHVVDSWPEENQQIVRKSRRLLPINVRVLDGVSLSDLKIKRNDNGTKGYELSD